MAKLWAIIKREYVERVRSKWFLIATFFGPIFFSAIIIVPAWLASRSKATSDVYNTTILDATGTNFGHRLAIAIAGDSTNPARMQIVKLVKGLAFLCYYGDDGMMKRLGYDADANVARGRELRAREGRP